MLFPEKEIILKDGRTAILRSPTTEDAAELLHYLLKSSEETEFLLRYPEECTLTLEQEEDFIRNAISNDSNLTICCFVDGKLTGNCSLTRHRRIKTMHRANIGIALLEEFWGLGIGTAMFQEMIRISKEWGLLQLELEVFESNERAMSLYHKMGFEIAAATPNAIRLKDGTLLKEFLMVKPL